jgi:hypothetical protein
MSALLKTTTNTNMKLRSSILPILITSVGLAGAAAAATVFTSVGSFPALTGSGPIEFQATTDTGNQLSHATFSSAVTAAFTDNTGGVLDYEFANEQDLPGTDVITFGAGGYKLGHSQLFNTASLTAGRTPTSGSAMSTFATNTPTITLGPIYDSSDNVISGVGVTQVGFAILSRNDYAANVQVTAHFSGGGTSVASRQIGQSAGGQDTFYGFIAPEGQTISSLGLVMTRVDTSGGAFMGLDDFGFVTNVPEPSVALIGGLGMLTLLRRRRRIEP